MEQPIIKINNLCFSYENKNIFCEASLEIFKGEFVGIIGRNGTGKSTLLRLILGELKAKQGMIEVDKNCSIGYTEQITMGKDLTFPATVYEIVMLGLCSKIGLCRFPKKEHKELVDKALELVGIKDFKNKQLSFLSGGEQQKVMLAKALVSDPDILILDEPTTGIDNASEKEFMNLITKLNKEHGKTVIMVTHNFNLLNGLDRIYKISDNSLRLVKNV